MRHLDRLKNSRFLFLFTLSILAVFWQVRIDWTSGSAGAQTVDQVDDWNPNLPVNTPIPYFRGNWGTHLLSDKRIIFPQNFAENETTGPLVMLNLTNGETTEIAKTGFFFRADKMAFHKNLLIYQDLDSVLYLLNLSSGAKNKLLNESDIRYTGQSERSRYDFVRFPALSEKYVVWRETDPANGARIRGKDLQTGEVFDISPSWPEVPGFANDSDAQGEGLSGPTISGNKVIWIGRVSWSTGNKAIFVRDIGTGEMIKLNDTDGKVNGYSRPKIVGTKVLWEQQSINQLPAEPIKVFVTDIGTQNTTLVATSQKYDWYVVTRNNLDMAGTKILYNAHSYRPYPIWKPSFAYVTDIDSPPHARGPDFEAAGRTLEFSDIPGFDPVRDASLIYTENLRRINIPLPNGSAPIAIEKISESEYLIALRATTQRWLDPSGPEWGQHYLMRLTPDYSDSTVTADREFVAQGETFAYTINAQNTGLVTDSNLVVTDTIPNDAVYLSSNYAPEINGKQLKFQLGQVRPGESKDIIIRLQATGPIYTPLVNLVEIDPGEKWREVLFEVDPFIVTPEEVLGADLPEDAVISVASSFGSMDALGPDGTSLLADGQTSVSNIQDFDVTILRNNAVVAKFNPYDPEQRALITFRLNRDADYSLKITRKKTATIYSTVRTLKDIDYWPSDRTGLTNWYGLINAPRIGPGNGVLIAPDGDYYLQLRAGTEVRKKTITVKGIPIR